MFITLTMATGRLERINVDKIVRYYESSVGPPTARTYVRFVDRDGSFYKDSPATIDNKLRKAASGAEPFVPHTPYPEEVIETP